MNQNICAKCQTPNIQNTPFCVGCGQPLAVQSGGYASNQPPAGNAPNYSANQPNAGQSANQQSPPAAKKSRMGMWLAIIGGVLALGVVILGITAFGIYYYVSSRQTDFNYNYNSSAANYSSNGNLSNAFGVNTATANSSTDSMTFDDSSITEEEKYRLFYAASKVGEQPLTVKISKKIGIIDEKGQATPYYKTFIAGMLSWATKDVEFVKKIDSKEKAREYVDSQMP